MLSCSIAVVNINFFKLKYKLLSVLKILLEKSSWNNIFTWKIIPLIRGKNTLFFIWTQGKSTTKQKTSGFCDTKLLWTLTLGCYVKKFFPFFNLFIFVLCAVTTCISFYIFYFYYFFCCDMIINLTSDFYGLIEMDEFLHRIFV